MNEPNNLCYVAAKRILRYLQVTKIKYQAEKEEELIGYTDSDQTSGLNDRKARQRPFFA